MRMEQAYIKKIWDLEVCRNIDLLKESNKTIIYGAAEKGEEIIGWLRDAELHVDFFCDMNMNKWGKCIENTEVISPFRLEDIVNKEKNDLVYIIACIRYPQELVKLLEETGLKNIRIITYWGIKTALQINAKMLYKREKRRIIELQIEEQQRKLKIISWAYKLLHDLISASDNAIWIVQPGKMATSSLEVRLREKNIPFIKEHILEFPGFVLGEEYKEIWEKRIQERKKKPLKIISAVREPISRDYSAFWQAFTEDQERMMISPILENNFQNMYEQYIEIIMRGSSYARKKMRNSLEYTWNDEFEWFDEQIKEYLGIDIFRYPFDPDKGYTIIKERNIELLLYKVEKMENILNIIEDFVGTEKLSSINTNISTQKWYGLAYMQFKRKVRLPIDYVNHYYVGNYKMDHFYSEIEKKKFLEKWEGNIWSGSRDE